MAFEGLAEKLNHIFSKITNRGKLTELEVKAALKEIKLVLLEADVNFKVVKGLIDRISERAVGQEVLSSLTPGQQVIKIVRDELVLTLGEKTEPVHFAANPPTIVMMWACRARARRRCAASLRRCGGRADAA
jgi:signal recognition particle subunit SRP54